VLRAAGDGGGGESGGKMDAAAGGDRAGDSAPVPSDGRRPDLGRDSFSGPDLVSFDVGGGSDRRRDLPGFDFGPPPDAGPDSRPPPPDDGGGGTGSDTPRFDGPPVDFHPPRSVVTGGSCASSDDCAPTTGGARGASPLCLPPSLGFAAGYCTNRGCQPGPSGGGCPGWAQCFPGDNGSYCLAICDPAVTGDCRPGYLCIDAGPPNAPVCYPGCLNDAGCPEGRTCTIAAGQSFGTCSNPAAAIGDSCGSSSECPSPALCLSERDFGYPHGYCAGPSCDPFSPGACPSGTACFGGDGGGSGSCFKQCAAQSDCRVGYACRPSPNGESVCVPRCEADAHCRNMTCHIGTGLC